MVILPSRDYNRYALQAILGDIIPYYKAILGDTIPVIATFLFRVCLHYILKTYVDENAELDFTLK